MIDINKNIITIQKNDQKLYIEIVSDEIIRVTDNLEYKSYSVVYKPKKVNFEVLEETNIIIKTSKVKVIIDNNFNVDFYDINNNPLSLSYKTNENKNNGLKTICYRNLRKDDYIYGLGDKTGYLNKRNYEYVNYNTDDPTVHVDTTLSLYKSINFFMVHNTENNYGIFFDNTYKTIYNFGKENTSYYFFGAVKGDLNYYFIYGKTLKEIIGKYTLLTGRYPLPQLFTLGNQQSRWSYMNEDEVLEVVNGYRNNNIPLDVIHLDIDYMERFKVFTNDQERYKNFKEFISSLNDMGIKIVTIIDPGVKVEKDYYVYEEGIKNNYFATKDSKVYTNHVWPGESVFPKFNDKNVRKWWSEKTKFLTDNGVSGIWNDMNEPASFLGPLPDDVEFNTKNEKHYHDEIHNVYGHLMAQATYEGLVKTNKRPFIITRACYAGSQRYSTAWTGDNFSIWPHLEMAIPQLCNLSMSGMPFIGTDIGGFSFDTTKELLARWIQVGMFSPLCRNHSSAGTRKQEPFRFDDELINIYRKFVNVRYQLLPYMYDLFYQHEKTGLPILRPLVLNYEDDTNTFEINDEFMVGDNLLVAPITKQGVSKRVVYLPKGNWYNFFTNKKYKGQKYYMMDAKLDELLLFVKENAIIPLFEVKQYIHDYDTLYLNVYGKKAKYVHYQDDYESFKYKTGEYNLYQFTYSNEKMNTKYLHEGFKKYTDIKVNKIS